MPFSKSQVVIIAGAVLIGLVLIGVIIGTGPGTKEKNQFAELKASLVFWGLFDDVSVYAPIIDAFKQKYPKVAIDYRSFADIDTYEFELLNALAEGRGPDIFAVPSAEVLKNASKIMPAPQSIISLSQFRNFFPEIAENDFVLNGQVYGLPLAIDTLALIYNKDIFNQTATLKPPETWEEFQRIAPGLVRLKKTGVGGILHSGAAIGGPSYGIKNAADIFELIMLQQEADKSGYQGLLSIDLEKAAAALDFYIGFGRSGSGVQAWVSGLPYSPDAFAEGKTAIIFGYAQDLKDLRVRAGFLKIGAGLMPQIEDGKYPLAKARYFGYAVSKQSRNPFLAWEFIYSMTANQFFAEQYLLTTGRPPALKSLIQRYLNDSEIGVFARQTLIAKSWRKIDEDETDDIFNSAIDQVFAGRLTRDALKDAKQKHQALKAKWGY